MLTKVFTGNSGNSPILGRPHNQGFFIEVKLAGMGRIAFPTRNLAAEPDIGAWNPFEVVAEIFSPHISRLQRQHIRFPDRLNCRAQRPPGQRASPGRDTSSFLCLHTRLIDRIHIDKNGQMAEMFVNQRFHVLPIQSADPCGQAWQRHALDLFSFNELGERFETVIDVLDGSLSWLGSMTGSRLLCKETHDSSSTDAGPSP